MVISISLMLGMGASPYAATPLEAPEAPAADAAPAPGEADPAPSGDADPSPSGELDSGPSEGPAPTPSGDASSSTAQEPAPSLPPQEPAPPSQPAPAPSAAPAQTPSPEGTPAPGGDVLPPAQDPGPQEPPAGSGGQETPAPSQPAPQPQEGGQPSQGGISSLTYATDPAPLTGEGGTVTFTIAGEHLEAGTAWVRILKNGAPYKTVFAQPEKGFFKAIAGLFTGENVRKLTTEAVKLSPSTADSMAVYTVAAAFTAGSVAPQEEGAWQPYGAPPIVLPKLGDNGAPPSPVVPGPLPPDENLDVAPAPVPGQSGQQGGSSSLNPEENLDVPSEPPVTSSTPESSSPQGPTPAPAPAPTPAPTATISAVRAYTAPDPLTSTGGYVTVQVEGEGLEEEAVYVRLSGPAGAQVVKADRAKGAAGVFTDRIPLPENTAQEEALYTVAVQHGPRLGKPAAGGDGWAEFPGASVRVPAPTAGGPATGETSPSESPSQAEGAPTLGEGAFEVAGVQSITSPAPLTSAGGVVTVALTGTALDTRNLWVKIEGGDKTQIKKITGAAPDHGVTAQLILKPNYSGSENQKYSVYVAASEESSTPAESDSRWKRYSQADFVVPKMTEAELPEVQSVVHNAASDKGEPATVFTLQGRNLGQGSNNQWVKLVPAGGEGKARIAQADQNVSGSCASTAPIRLETEVKYKVYAMAKAEKGKPGADDEGWRPFGSTDPLPGEDALRIDAVSILPQSLPGEGGAVSVAVRGANLEKERLLVRVGSPQNPEEAFVVDEAVYDPASGQAVMGFTLPANNSLLSEQVYPVSLCTGRNGRFEERGAVIVAKRLGVRVETFRDAATPGALTPAGGLLRCTLTGVGPEEQLWVKVSDNKEHQVLPAALSGDGAAAGFFTIAPNSGDSAREAAVSVISSAGTPQAVQKGWEEVARVAVPSGHEGKGKAQIEGLSLSTSPAALTSEGGQVKVRLTGENLESQNLFVRLTEKASGDEIAAVPQTVGAGSAEAVLEVPANGTDYTQLYNVSYSATYAGTPSTYSWVTAAGDENLVVVPRAATGGANATSVSVFSNPEPLTSVGGTIKVTVNGTNMNTGAVWVSISSNHPTFNQTFVPKLADHEKTSTTTSTANIDIPENTTNSYQVYNVSVNTDGDQSGPGESFLSMASFLVPPGAAGNIIDTSVTLPPDFTSAGSDQVIATVTGSGLNGTTLTPLYVYVEYKQIYPTTGEAKYAQANVNTAGTSAGTTLNIPANTSVVSDAIYLVRSVVTTKRAEEITSDEFDRQGYNPSCEFSVPRMDAALPTITGLTTTVEPEPLTSAGGQLKFRVQGTNFEQMSGAAILVKVVGPGTGEAGKVFSMSPDPVNGAATLESTYTLPENTSQMPAIYKLYAALSSADPASPYIKWTYQKDVVVPAPDGAAITKVNISPNVQSTMKVGDVVTIGVSGTDLTSQLRLRWKPSAGQTGYIEYTNQEDTANARFSREFVQEDAGQSFDFYLDLFPSPQFQGSVSSQLLFRVDNVTPAVSDTIYITQNNYSTIKAEDGATISVELKKYYFDSRPYYLCAYEPASGAIAAGPVELTNFRQDMPYNGLPVYASAALTFANPVAGASYVIAVTDATGSSFKPVTPATSAVFNTVKVASPTTPYDPTQNPDTPPDDPSSSSEPNDSSGSSSNGSSSDPSGSSSSTSSGNTLSTTPSGSTSSGSDDGKRYINKDVLEDALKEYENDDEVIIRIKDKNTVITDDFFEAADNLDKKIILRGSDYYWTIPRHSDMDGDLKSTYNLGVDFDDYYEDEMEDLAGRGADIYPFYIKYHGKLPCKMLLTLYTDYRKGTDVWVYRYNEDDDDATLIAEETVGSDGKVSFYMTKCSYYFVSDEKVKGARSDSSRSTSTSDLDYIEKINPGTGPILGLPASHVPRALLKTPKPF